MSKRLRGRAKSEATQPALESAASDWWVNPLIYLVLVLVIVCAFAQVRQFDFVNFDDPAYVSQNQHTLKGLTADGVLWAFTSTDDANWFPMTWISLMADGQLYGAGAGGYHTTNVLLHILSSLLLFAFLKRTTGTRWASALVAFLFGVHPLHVESVAWIAERKDVLSAFFFFLALWAYSRYAEMPGWLRYCGVALVFGLGLMSKSMLVTLPFVLLLLDFWPLRRGWRAFLIWEKLPLLAMSIGASVVTFLVQRGGGAMAPIGKTPFLLRIENALVSYVMYIVELVWPANLAVFYPYPALSVWTGVLVAAFLVAITMVVVRDLRPRPYLAVGWFWYLGMLLPVIGLVQVGAQARADRFMYLPMVGLLIMLAWGARDMASRWPSARIMIVGAGVTACGASMAMAAIQTHYWHDSQTILEHALAVTGDNVFADINLGELYLDEGRFTEALTRGQSAVRLAPDSPEAHINLAGAFGNLGKPADAEVQYREAIRYQPGNAKGHTWLGVSLIQQGRTEEALREELAAVRLDPDSSWARDNLGRLLASVDRVDEAIPQFQEALRLEPANAEVHCHFGIALGNAGKFDDAIREFGEAARLSPAYADAHFNWGSALAQQGNLDGAIEQFNQTLSLVPDFPGAKESLDHALELKKIPAK